MSKNMLTKESFDTARYFIETQSRLIEISHFQHAFDDGSVGPVIDALKSYQNPDGGFGHALEPDLRTIDSSALCTSIAFQVLRSIHASPEEPLVKSAVAYLLETMDRQNNHWQIIPNSAGQSPHAPWWDTTGREQEFSAFSLNPTAELLGYLYDYLDERQQDILMSVAAHVLSYLTGLETIVMHDFLCCLRLLETQTLPDEIERTIFRKLNPLIDGILSNDPSQWMNYGLRPLQVIDDPASPFMMGRKSAVEANLDYEISSQNEDGSWSPNWTWGGLYPDVWPVAYREWSGALTLDKLILLKRFHRIEGIA